MSQTMDESISIDYLEKKQAMLQASNAMENALKIIADVFKNIQADNLSLADDNKRLQLSVRELREEKDKCALCRKKSNQEVEPLSCNKIIQEDRNEHYPRICRDAETPWIIENTQMEEIVLTKPKSKHLGKRLNFLFDDNTLNNFSTPVNTRSKNQKQSRVAKVSAEIVILTNSKVSRQDTNILQSVEETAGEIVHENRKNDVKLEPEYLDIDATLFEQPFSQEPSPDKKVLTSCHVDTTESFEKDPRTKSPRAKSFLDDVVEVSPKKDVSRKKNWLRHNRHTAKSCMNNPSPDLAGTSNADNNDKDSCTQKSLKSITPKEKGGELNGDVAMIERKIRTPSSKKNISLSEKRNEYLAPAVITESTILPVPATETITTVVTSNLDAQIATDKENNAVTVTKNLSETQSGEPTSDETYFAGDETYFHGHGIPRKANCNKETGGILNKAKRKFSDIDALSDMEKNVDTASSELDLDIGDMSDWDTDVSCDKWSSATPRKRAPDNSFDVVPVKKVAPKFATKGPVVRNKLERAKLRGWDCENCAQYYENMSLSEKELVKRKDLCSRHRSKFNERYYSPPGLWDLRFPDTQSSSLG